MYSTNGRRFARATAPTADVDPRAHRTRILADEYDRRDEPLNCPACGTANEPDRKFCGECGTPLACRVPDLRGDERARREVLRRVRHGPARSRGRARPRTRRPASRDGRASARVDPLRRPRRVHDPVRVPRRRDRPRAAGPLLRDGHPDHRLVRRHHREVHRRRGHGGLGCADRLRGRRRASGPQRPRPGRRRRGARPSRSARSSGCERAS